MCVKPSITQRTFGSSIAFGGSNCQIRVDYGPARVMWDTSLCVAEQSNGTVVGFQSSQTLMLRPNVLRFSCHRGAAKTVKKRTISRAEGGQLQAPVGLPV
jgi:hypothetical protein